MLAAKRTTTAAVSKRRSTAMVTKAGPGRTLRSRTERKAGRRTSPTARPTRKIAPKPTVVAANDSRRETRGASGASSVRQRKARIR